MASPESSPEQEPEPLLNIYEVDHDGERRHFVCFLETARAQAEGINSDAIVGEFQPGPDGGFDAETFRPNDVFVRSLTRYMNEVVAATADVIRAAAHQTTGKLYVIDPRFPLQPNVEPPADEVVGAFDVGGDKAIAPGSFRYNDHHVWFHGGTGVSGVLNDRRFYDWLHAEASAGE